MDKEIIGSTFILIVVIFLFIASLYPIAFFVVNVLDVPWWSFNFYINIIGINIVWAVMYANTVREKLQK